VLHALFVVMLPLIMIGASLIDATWLAAIAVVVSKWRMFAVRPRYWLANVRANLVDITVGIAAVSYMSQTDSVLTITIWGVLYGIWILVLKPMSKPAAMTLQALVAQALGLGALYTNHNEANTVILILLTWLICFGSSRHLLTTFEDSENRILTHFWALFAAQIALILTHWQIVYANSVPQIALVLTLIGYPLAVGYYLHKTRGLRAGIRSQMIVFVSIALVAVIVFSDWQYKGF